MAAKVYSQILASHIPLFNDAFQGLLQLIPKYEVVTNMQKSKSYIKFSIAINNDDIDNMAIAVTKNQIVNDFHFGINNSYDISKKLLIHYEAISDGVCTFFSIEAAYADDPSIESKVTH
jgi:hypothetical protein